MADPKDPAANTEADKPTDSKPAIITHRAILQDAPSTDSTAPAADATPETKPVAKSSPIKLKPLEEPSPGTPTEEKNSETPDEAIKVKTAISPKADEPAPQSLADIKAPEEPAKEKVDEAPVSKEETKSEPSPQTEETPSTSAETTDLETSSETDAGKPLDPTAAAKAEEAEQAKHDAAIQKLADSKQYYLPINAVEKRRTKRFVALGVLLSLILIVFWVDVALDAGLIKMSGIKPVTHFFSN